MDSADKVRKKQIILAASIVLGVVGVLVLGLWISDPQRGSPTAEEVKRMKDGEIDRKYSIDSKTVLSDEERWVAKSEMKFQDMNKENEILKERLKTMDSRLNELQEKQKEADEKGINEKKGPQKETVNFNKPLLDNINTPLPPPPLVGGIGMGPDLGAFNGNGGNAGGGGQAQQRAESGILSISLDSDTSPLDKNLEKAKKKNVASYLPAGTFAKVGLLSGLDAPTGGLATKDPMPVLMKITDMGKLPNKFKSNVKECHVTGAAYGEISSERAYIRLEKMGCVLKNGDVVEVDIKGFVAGEDGKPGFRGELVSKQGSMIAKAALAGTFSGLGAAVSQSYQTISTNPLGGTTQTFDAKRVGEAGLANGASSALNKIADFYIARANETYPIIEVASGRKGEMVLSGGVDLGDNILEFRDLDGGKK